MSDPRGVQVSVVVDGIQVETDFDITPRHRLFLRSIGAVAGAGGRTWTVPLRLLSRAEVIGRLHSQFSRDGIAVGLVGEADREATEELERLRSFQRTMRAGREFHDSGSPLSAGTIRAQLDLIGWDFAARDLRPHQMAAVAHALTVMHAANFSVPGAGKTAATLAVIACHLASETIDTIVVVGPLASFGPWEAEAAAALPDVLDVRRVRGANIAARAFAYRAAGSRSLLLLTYPTVVADLSKLLRLTERRNVLLVIDESHRIKRFRGGQWAPAMVRLASASKVRMILSGTPMPQGPLDLWSQLNVLWPREQLTGSRSTFKARADSNFASLAHDLEPVFTRTPKSALGIPPYEVLRHAVEAPPLQREVVDLITDPLPEKSSRRRVMAGQARLAPAGPPASPDPGRLQPRSPKHERRILRAAPIR